MIFEQNIGSYLSLDETAFSKGELYTILSNKSTNGKKGSIVAIIKGTKSDYIINKLNSISSSLRNKVKEITLDMAGSMNRIAQKCFPKAIRVTDRFHVQKLAYDAVQQLRVKHRWEAIELMANSNEPEIELSNQDTLKQLLARSRYLLFKPENKWTTTQKERADLLFRLYPDIKQAYKLARKLGQIYDSTTNKGVAFTKMAHWFKEVEDSKIGCFKTVKRTFGIHYPEILNYFDNRSTNASAESLNAKIKDFRRNLRGVRDVNFFLFRLTNIFA